MKAKNITKGRPIEELEALRFRVAELKKSESERQRVEGKIRQAAEEWRVTFDSIADSVSIIDKDFKLLRVNKAYANAFKMHPKELIDKTCYEVVHRTIKPWIGLRVRNMALSCWI